MPQPYSIAAVIPLYNGREFIRRSLESVLAQERQPDEIIVVDDGSSDDGARIAREVAGADKRFRLLSQPNAGQSAARNFGIRESSSTLIALLDQDDWWYVDHLRRLEVPFLNEERPRPLGWTYSEVDEFDRVGRLMTANLLATMNAQHPKRSIAACLGRDMHVLPSASLFSRIAFDHVGGFDDKLSGYEDDDFFIRLFAAGFDNVFLRRALSAWRIHPNSSSYTTRMTSSGMHYASKLFAAYPDEPKRQRYYVRDLIAPRFTMVALTDYSRTVTDGRREDFAGSLRHLDSVRGRLGLRHRLILTVLRPLLGLWPIARVVWALRLYRLGGRWLA